MSAVAVDTGDGVGGIDGVGDWAYVVVVVTEAGSVVTSKGSSLLG